MENMIKEPQQQQQPAASNPLSSFFRQPAIYIKLPSNGQFWKEGALDLPASGEIPILSMTTKDEITLRTPDALLNGEGVVSVIQSCCPNIKDAWQMPSIDVDTVLIALRVASYGNSMDIEAKCPHCSEENTYEVGLDSVVNSIVIPNYNEPIIINGLSVKLRPQPYFSVNKTSMINFEEQQILRTINDESFSPEEKSAKFAEHMRKLVDLNLNVMANSTESITTPNGDVVTSTDFIREFYQNTDRSVVKSIRDWLEKAAADLSIKPISVNCSNCDKAFDLTITFDYSNFFG